MKQCNHCGKWKDESEFNWRWKERGIRQKFCRDCKRIHQKNWYESHKRTHIKNVKERKKYTIPEAKQYVWDYLSSHPCVDCGEFDPVVLEFDHKDPSQKEKNVAAMSGEGYSIESIQAEIAKCEVRCANCHRRKTSRERGWFRG